MFSYLITAPTIMFVEEKTKHNPINVVGLDGNIICQ